MSKIFTEKAERINGWFAMIGFVAAAGRAIDRARRWQGRTTSHPRPRSLGP
mgnify:CR=1 FL=1